MDDFYVYTHADPNTLEIRYVGKGHNRRAYSLSKRYKHHKNWINTLKEKNQKPIVDMIESGLTEEEAYCREEYWIAKFRSLAYPLTNLTDGGTGILSFKHSEDTIERMRIAQKNRVHSKEEIAILVEYRRQHGYTFKKGFTPWNKGIKMDEKAIEAMAISKSKATNTTGFMGVTYEKERNKFVAQKVIHGKHFKIGRYNTAEEASIAYQYFINNFKTNSNVI